MIYNYMVINKYIVNWKYIIFYRLMFWFVIDWNILLYINFLRSVRGIKWIEMLYVDDWKRVLD